jgi:hypothetical protein
VVCGDLIRVFGETQNPKLTRPNDGREKFCCYLYFIFRVELTPKKFHEERKPKKCLRKDEERARIQEERVREEAERQQ